MNCLQVLWVHPDIKSFEHLSNVTIGRIQESSDNDMYEKEGHLHVSRNIQCTFVHPDNERLLRRFHKKIISIFVISTINGKLEKSKKVYLCQICLTCFCFVFLNKCL